MSVLPTCLTTRKVMAVALYGFSFQGCHGRWPKAEHMGLPAQESPGILRSCSAHPRTGGGSLGLSPCSPQIASLLASLLHSS